MRNEITVSTIGTLANALENKKAFISQFALIVLDDIPTYHSLFKFIIECPTLQQPRILATTSSPCADVQNTGEILIPFSPYLGDEQIKNNIVGSSLEIVEVFKSEFEKEFPTLVLEFIQSISKLHDFFVSNLKEAPDADVTTRMKYTLKILKLSKMVADNDRDSVLLQLTHLIRKWIDAFEMLPTFGPRKILQQIKDDIGLANTDSLSTIEAHIVLATMRKRIIQIEADWNKSGVGEDSSRVVELLNQLEKCGNEQQRIFILVDSSITAERLCQRLKSETIVSKMNPQNLDGLTKMHQEATLAKFCKRECKVLIGLSLYHLGECEVIISFSGSINMISKSSPKTGTKYIVLATKDEQQRFEKKLEMEQAFENLMVDKKASFETQHEREMKLFLDDLSEQNFQPADGFRKLTI